MIFLVLGAIVNKLKFLDYPCDAMFCLRRVS
jgi:hypothetical protein